MEVSAMQSGHLNQARHRWPEISHFVYVPHSEQEYQGLIAVLDQLSDEVGEDESHPLASMMEVIGVLVERYENEHVPELSEALLEKKDPPERTQSIQLD
jgi:HTH-type transcriptional regulator/antitoxin HigA